MTTPTIVRADHANAATVAGVIAVAFDALPAARWLVPEPADRVDVLSGDFAIYVEHALSYGEVHLTADGAAAAVWLDMTQQVPAPSDYESRLAAACGQYLDRFRVLDHLFEQHHPGKPHHHLALLAVRPGRQNQGLGSALLRHHHSHLDRYAIPAYLEASSTGSRDLYTRHGYHAGEPFHLPDGGPPFWPMWRDPQPTDPPRRQPELGPH